MQFSGRAGVTHPMKQPQARFQTLARAVRLRCPACGVGPLFRGLFAMAPGCGHCGYSYKREPGFYLGSIYINYGVTAIGTILLYALVVMAFGASHQRALAVSLVVAVLFPVVFFRWARALLLALDNSVNANQSHGQAASAQPGAAAAAGLTEGHLAHLRADDGNAGCLMGIVLALILLFGLLMAGVTLSFIMSAADAAPPAAATNVIVVLVDDLGWRDLSCQGSPYFETPNIDRLAASGMRFTHGYSACTVCSPSRAAMMTGQYPARLHVTDWIPGHRRPHAKLEVPAWRKFLPLETVTVAERLKTAGYATACIGKWHLGGPEHFPEHQGFDEALGGTERGQPPSYFAPYGIPTLPEGPAGEYLTDREAAEAVRFIEAHRDRPFFLYLPHYCVHTPIQAKPAVRARYEAKDAGGLAVKNAGYAAMVESVDDSLGTILAALDRLGIRERTAIVFTSDNGGLVGSTDNAPARAGKGSAYEGGVRVPFIVSWPGVTRPGTTSAEPVITPDVPATILDLTGAAAEPGQPLDGVSLGPALRGEPLGRDALYWHYPHYHPGGATPYSAIRAGDWRLVRFHEDGRQELYDLRGDVGETTDLAAREPERVTALAAQLDDWLARVGAQMPAPNPAADPARDRPPRGRTGPTGRDEAAPAAVRSRPNVLFVIADDASLQFGCYGCRWTRTPAVDRLAREGLVFDAAYVPTSKCAPARAAILTGRNPWQLEAAANHWPTFPPKYMAFTEVLAARGIACGGAGKIWGPGTALTAAGVRRT